MNKGLKLQVPLLDTVEFIVCCEETINNRSFIQPYNGTREAVVFSFDNQLRPSLNYTKGYHRTVAKRPYFLRSPRLIDQIRKLMRPYRGYGGRVFIDRRTVYYVDEDRIQHHLCDLSWPAGIDVVAVVKNLKPKPTSTFTLRPRVSRK